MAGSPAERTHIEFPFDLRDSEKETPAKQTTREALIEAAAEAFGEFGFDGVSIRDIERRAGVNRGLVSHYFGNKDGLWDAAVGEMMRGIGVELARYADILDVVSEAERGRIFLKAYMRFLRRRPALFRLIIHEGDKDTRRSRALTQSFMGQLERFWQQATGVDPNLPPEVHAIRHFILLGAGGAMFAVPEYAKELFGVDVHDPEFADRYAEVVAEMWLRVRDFVEG